MAYGVLIPWTWDSPASSPVFRRCSCPSTIFFGVLPPNPRHPPEYMPSDPRLSSKSACAPAKMHPLANDLSIFVYDVR